MAQQNSTKKKSPSRDDEYKNAVQPLVSEAMEAHNLAPAITEAIKENKPLNDQLQLTIAESIERSPEVKKALDRVISDNEIIKKSKAAWKKPTFWVPIAISTAVGIAGVIVAIVK